MIRRIFSSHFTGIPFPKNRVVATAASLTLGILFVLLASAFIEIGERLQVSPSHTDRVFRVNKWIEKPGEERQPSTKTPGLMGPAIATQIPAIESAARLMTWPEAVVVSSYNRSASSQRWAFADPAFLQVFEIEFLSGNAQTALNEPGKVVLCETMARKMFGNTDAVGKTLLGLGGKTYTVSGVIRNPARQSTVQYDLIASWSSTEQHSGVHNFRFMNNWTASTAETFVLLRNAGDADNLKGQLSEVLRRQVSGQPGQYSFFLQPVWETGQKSGAAGGAGKDKFNTTTYVPGGNSFLLDACKSI